MKTRYINGVFYTLNPLQPHVTELWVEDGKISFLGSSILDSTLLNSRVGLFFLIFSFFSIIFSSKTITSKGGFSSLFSVFFETNLIFFLT